MKSIKHQQLFDGIVDYEKYKEETREKLKILLTRNIDKQRFGTYINILEMRRLKLNSIIDHIILK